MLAIDPIRAAILLIIGNQIVQYLSPFNLGSFFMVRLDTLYNRRKDTYLSTATRNKAGDFINNKYRNLLAKWVIGPHSILNM
jgi:hypothetical protein